MSSKLLAERERSSRRVTTLLRENVGRIVSGTQEMLSPHLRDDEKLPDIGFLVELLARSLESRTEALMHCDGKVKAEKADDARPRSARDHAFVSLREQLATLRLAVESSHGYPAMKALGLTRPVPPDVAGTLEYGQRVIGTLRDSAIDLPVLRSTHIAALDREAFAKDLDTAAQALSSALQTVAREASELRNAQNQKDRATEAYDRMFRIVALAGVFLVHLGGLEDLAPKLRLSHRRPGTLEDENV